MPGVTVAGIRRAGAARTPVVGPAEVRRRRMPSSVTHPVTRWVGGAWQASAASHRKASAGPLAMCLILTGSGAGPKVRRQ
jgi:hypothetical protein